MLAAAARRESRIARALAAPSAVPAMGQGAVLEVIGLILPQAVSQRHGPLPPRTTVSPVFGLVASCMRNGNANPCLTPLSVPSDACADVA